MLEAGLIEFDVEEYNEYQKVAVKLRAGIISKLGGVLVPHNFEEVINEVTKEVIMGCPIEKEISDHHFREAEAAFLADAEEKREEEEYAEKLESAKKEVSDGCRRAKMEGPTDYQLGDAHHRMVKRLDEVVASWRVGDQSELGKIFDESLEEAVYEDLKDWAEEEYNVEWTD